MKDFTCWGEERFEFLFQRELMRLVAGDAESFQDALADWINIALGRGLSLDWRQRLAAQLRLWSPGDYEIPSEYLYILEDWIEAGAYVRRRLPVSADGQEVPPRPGNIYLANARMYAEPAATHGTPKAMLVAHRKRRPEATGDSGANTSPPKPAPVPIPVFEDGVEVAGPGPETTTSYRKRVLQALGIVDPWLARWWASTTHSGTIRARKKPFPAVLRESDFGEMQGEHPIITVDEHFSVGETVAAILREATVGKFRDSFEQYVTAHLGPEQQVRVERERFRQAAGYAATIAKIYVTALASTGPVGSLVVLIDDVAEEGLQWHQIFLALPLMAYFKRGGKALVLRIAGKGLVAAREIILSDAFLSEFEFLDVAERKAIAARAAAAKTPEEGLAIIERELAARRGRPGGAGPTVSGKLAGAWVKVNEAMSERARAYQTQITGRTGEAYRLNGVDFDGELNGVLLEAKGPGYDSFIKDGNFRDWFTKDGKILKQARDQLRAAPGVPIVWHVAEADFAAMLQNVFAGEGIRIKVIHTSAFQ